MAGLKQSGAFTIEGPTLAKIRAEFGAGRSTVKETDETIRTVLARTGLLLDPHTAIAVKVAAEHHTESPMVVLATAHRRSSRRPCMARPA